MKVKLKIIDIRDSKNVKTITRFYNNLSLECIKIKNKFFLNIPDKYQDINLTSIKFNANENINNNLLENCTNGNLSTFISKMFLEDKIIEIVIRVLKYNKLEVFNIIQVSENDLNHLRNIPTGSVY